MCDTRVAPSPLTHPPGHYRSFRQGIHKVANKVIPDSRSHVSRRDNYPVERAEPRESRGSRGSSGGAPAIPNTVTIPCHHVRIGDFLMLQHRPCQVIRISTSAATGQYRYLGVDLFTKQLHEESSFIAHPAPSVVVQTMLGPIFKQYRVLDMQEGDSKFDSSRVPPAFSIVRVVYEE